MLELQCGKVKIPLVLCSGLSWTRTSRTAERTGGYIVPLGFETVEVSVRVVYNYGVVYSLGLDAASLYRSLSMLATDCSDNPDRLVVGGFEPLPSLLFALTSCNRTQVVDASFDPSMELDLVFSGVRCKKEAARSECLSEEPSGQIPEIIIKRGEKSISLKDSYSISNCIQRDNSLSLSFVVRDDLSIVDRDGFLNKLVDGKAVCLFNDLIYHIISSSIDSNEVSLECSMWPIEAQKPFIKTYRDTTLKSVISDLAAKAGVKIDCRIDGKVDYFLNSQSPMDSIASLIESTGALSFWRKDELLVVKTPSFIQSSEVLEAYTTASNEETEPITSCVWSDGIVSSVAGDSSGAGISIYSVYHGEEKATECLKKAQFNQHSIQCSCQASSSIQPGSAFGVWIETNLVDCIITSIEMDWLTGSGIYLLNYV